MFIIVILSLLIAVLLPLLELSILSFLSNHSPKLHLYFSPPSDHFCWDAGLSSEPVYNFQWSLPFFHYPKLEASKLSSDHASFKISFASVLFLLLSLHLHFRSEVLKYLINLSPFLYHLPSPIQPWMQPIHLMHNGWPDSTSWKIEIYRPLRYSNAFSAFLYPEERVLDWGPRMGFRVFITCPILLKITCMKILSICA